VPVLAELLFLALIGYSLTFRPWTAEGVLKMRRYLSRVYPYPLSWLAAISRVSFAAAIGFALAGVGLLLVELGKRSLVPMTPSTIGIVGKLAAGVMGLTVFGIILPSVLFNRPRFLVPKGLRQEPGLILVGARAVVRAARWVRSKISTG
jgi:hypothetical protein